MEYNVDVFSEQFPIVKRFLYHLTCYRELYRIYQDLDLKSEFWTHTIDAHLLQAAILWCMVFGSDGNPTHWKKLCDQDIGSLKDSFRNGLFEETKLTKKTWDTYWKTMNDFRGAYVAHQELNYSNSVPDFTTAQEVAFFYDKWIRSLIAPDVFDEPPLKESVEIIQKRIRPLAMHYLAEIKLRKSNTEPQL